MTTEKPGIVRFLAKLINTSIENRAKSVLSVWINQWITLSGAQALSTFAIQRDGLAQVYLEYKKGNFAIDQIADTFVDRTP